MTQKSERQKSALITGAARRIGRAVALELARGGWAVAIHYRNSSVDAEKLAEHIRSEGGRAEIFSADLKDLAAIDRLVADIGRSMGPLTALINNASEFQPDSIETLDEATWDLHLDVNLKAPAFLSKAMAAQLPPDAEGNIVNIIDQRVWNLTPDFFSYTVSKAGLWATTRMLAQALAPRIRVNAIAPGPVLQSVHQTAQDFAHEAQSTLLGHGPTPEEIAGAVRFILATSSITGQMIVLDGGQHLT
ncbi:short chain dehydrogenase [Hyphomicrobium methylovorum]|uniref:SDR family oxidoreductase n=1 Tax=Hyphomicrobium methylovorum TaxID=84 RepID=UPI0015E63185|nr:SDR family oxidoreductase [Hyphomicrobium methylovorum]MBA2127268.1 short chain dehydrogenase [Hyphomicrobium methylovorum]